MKIKNCHTSNTGWILAALLAVLPTILINYEPFLGNAMGAESQLLSLDSQGEPLGEVLKKISDQTGYRITVNPDWVDLPVNGSFKNLHVDQGLRKILANLNHAILFNDTDQRISIVIKSFIYKDEFPIGMTENTVNDSPTSALKKAKTPQSNSINPADIQVVPPAGPGESPITLREMQTEEAQRVKILPKDIEVIPPPELGGKGVSLIEINAQQSLQKPPIFIEKELVPPDGINRK
jgi:hypothetical protein